MKGSELVSRREALGLNQSQAAEFLGIDRTTLVRWEKSDEIPRLAAAGAANLLKPGREVNDWVASLKPAARRGIYQRITENIEAAIELSRNTPAEGPEIDIIHGVLAGKRPDEITLIADRASICIDQVVIFLNTMTISQYNCSALLRAAVELGWIMLGELPEGEYGRGQEINIAQRSTDNGEKNAEEVRPEPAQPEGSDGIPVCPPCEGATASQLDAREVVPMAEAQHNPGDEGACPGAGGDLQELGGNGGEKDLSDGSLPALAAEFKQAVIEQASVARGASRHDGTATVPDPAGINPLTFDPATMPYGGIARPLPDDSTPPIHEALEPLDISNWPNSCAECSMKESYDRMGITLPEANECGGCPNFKEEPAIDAQKAEKARKVLKVMLTQYGAKGLRELSGKTGIPGPIIRCFVFEEGPLTAVQFSAVLDVLREVEAV